MNVLVVGANGQLGSACCRELVAQGHEVRGSVRDLERAAGLGLDGVGLVVADLARDRNLDPMLAGVEAIVLSANSAAPRAGDDPRAFDDGEARLVAAAGRLGVRRIILPSIPVSDVDGKVPLVAERRRLEELALAAAPESVILRFPPFMDTWLAFVGSSLPSRGVPNATVDRPSPFLRRFRGATASTVEKRGRMLVPGPTTYRQAFISVADAAAACAVAVSRPDLAGKAVDVGGPEALSWVDVAGIYSRVLGRPVRAVSTPTAVFAAMAAFLRPFASVPSRTMALNRLVGAAETEWEAGGGLLDPASMTTVEQFLTSKAALPDTRSVTT